MGDASQKLPFEKSDFGFLGGKLLSLNVKCSTYNSGLDLIQIALYVCSLGGCHMLKSKRSEDLNHWKWFSESFDVSVDY